MYNIDAQPQRHYMQESNGDDTLILLPHSESSNGTPRQAIESILLRYQHRIPIMTELGHSLKFRFHSVRYRKSGSLGLYRPI